VSGVRRRVRAETLRESGNERPKREEEAREWAMSSILAPVNGPSSPKDRSTPLRCVPSSTCNVPSDIFRLFGFALSEEYFNCWSVATRLRLKSN